MWEAVHAAWSLEDTLADTHRWKTIYLWGMQEEIPAGMAPPETCTHPQWSQTLCLWPVWERVQSVFQSKETFPHSFSWEGKKKCSDAGLQLALSHPLCWIVHWNMTLASHSDWKNWGQDFVEVSAEECAWPRNGELMEEWRKLPWGMFSVFLLDFWNEDYVCEACNKCEVNKKRHDF